LPYAPRDIASINFGYQHPVGINARIGVDYVSQQYVDPDNTTVESLDGQEGKIPAYTLLNASINFRAIGSKLTYFISGHNLADKEYLISRVDGKVAGRQRQVFGGIRYDF
jgi:Fe(3+) dicitrate transport protein